LHTLLLLLLLGPVMLLPLLQEVQVTRDPLLLPPLPVLMHVLLLKVMTRLKCQVINTVVPFALLLLLLLACWRQLPTQPLLQLQLLRQRQRQLLLLSRTPRAGKWCASGGWQQRQVLPMQPPLVRQPRVATAAGPALPCLQSSSSSCTRSTAADLRYRPLQVGFQHPLRR
jgi:hypothetical protein